METEEILAAIQRAADTIAKPNCTAWLSALAALGAVAVAIIVAVKQNNIAKKQNKIVLKQAEISEQQNRIALFDKRYEVYGELLKICNISNQIECINEHQRMPLLCAVEAIYEIEIVNKNSINTQLNVVITRIKKSEYILHQSEFLFSNIDGENVKELIGNLLTCLIFIVKETNIPVSKDIPEMKNFIDVCNDFMQKYSNMMEKELSLK